MKKLFTTKNLVVMAMLSALAAVLMLFEFQIPFIAPWFYELDLSEVPILIGTFMIGPVAGVIMEAIKIMLNLIMNQTITWGVGEFANFCIGCCFIVPAGIIYSKKKTKKNAIVGMIIGTLVITIVGAILNYYVMIPFYSNFMDINEIIKAGAAINPLVKDEFTLVLICVAPFNLLKGILNSVITLLIYKRISTFIKRIGN